jgi:hypothetical protein
MNNSSQEEFERSIILETDLFNKCDGDDQMESTLDDLCNYVTLEELYSEYGRDLEQEFREKLYTFLNIVFSQLEKDEVKLMEMKSNSSLTKRKRLLINLLD